MRKLSHVQYDIEDHIVWTTKYRYPVLKGTITEKTIKDYIENQENESEENFKIVN